MLVSVALVLFAMFALAMPRDSLTAGARIIVGRIAAGIAIGESFELLQMLGVVALAALLSLVICRAISRMCILVGEGRVALVKEGRSIVWKTCIYLCSDGSSMRLYAPVLHGECPPMMLF